MKTIKYLPQPSEEKKDDGKIEMLAPDFSGHVMLSVLPYPDRMKALKELRVKISGEGKTSIEDDPLESATKAYELVKKHSASVELVHIKTGEVISSIEDLGYSQEGSRLIGQMGNVLVGGVRLGESSPQI